MDHQKAFIEIIEADPLNQDVRLVYSDWLLENDQPEEAERQQGYLKALYFIAEFTREGDENKRLYDEDYNEIPGPPHFDWKKIIDEVEWWRQCVTKEYTKYGLGGTIGFGTDHASDALMDDATRREFWQCFKILTKVEAPEELRKQKRYHCAC